MDSLIFELQIVFYFQLFFSANVSHTPKRGHTGSVDASIVLYCATSHCSYSLSSAEVSLCCGEAGEKEKESARGTSSTARFLFFSSTEYIFIGITIHWGGDRLVLQRAARAGSKGRTTCNVYNKRAVFDVSTSQAHGQSVLT